jgi:hypothetical protein
MLRLYQKSILSSCYLILVRAPTTKAVGSEYVTKFEPMDLSVGPLKKRGNLAFETSSAQHYDRFMATL